MIKTTCISLLIASTLAGCSEEASSEKPSSETTESLLIAAEPIHTISLETLQGFAQLAGQPEITALVKHGVETFKITYQTTYNGSAIQASGLLYVPQDLKGPAPLISLQHGTTFVKDDAPSTAGEFTGMEYFAAGGYMALMPDYIGYGASAEIFHPYYDAPHSASVVIDMIHAVKEFLTQEKIAFNDQLFLAGYSEGGYVTLATAKEIENNIAHSLTVTAVAAGAGGYDLREMLQSIITSTHYANPGYLAFILKAYNITYQWNKPFSYFFRDEYAQVVDTYLDGQHEGWLINSKLTTQVNVLLNPEFYEGLKTDAGEPELKNALQHNSVNGWKSAIPIRLYHGTMDEIIPYQNSETTLENFKTAGSSDVSLTLIPGGTHGNSFLPMLKQFVPWFESLRK